MAGVDVNSAMACLVKLWRKLVQELAGQAKPKTLWDRSGAVPAPPSIKVLRGSLESRVRWRVSDLLGSTSDASAPEARDQPNSCGLWASGSQETWWSLVLDSALPWKLAIQGDAFKHSTHQRHSGLQALHRLQRLCLKRAIMRKAIMRKANMTPTDQLKSGAM